MTTIPTNVIHTCHGGFHVDFSSLKMSWVMVQNYPHVNLQWGPMTLSTNEISRILKSHGLMAFLKPNNALLMAYETI
jgi:hypothetical protein